MRETIYEVLTFPSYPTCFFFVFLFNITNQILRGHAHSLLVRPELKGKGRGCPEGTRFVHQQWAPLDGTRALGEVVRTLLELETQIKFSPCVPFSLLSLAFLLSHFSSNDISSTFPHSCSSSFPALSPHIKSSSNFLNLVPHLSPPFSGEMHIRRVTQKKLQSVKKPVEWLT